MYANETALPTNARWRHHLRWLVATIVSVALVTGGFGVATAGTVPAASVQSTGTQPVAFDLSARLRVADLNLDFPGVQLTGTWNPTTGSFTNGSVNLPDQPVELPPIPGYPDLQATARFTATPIGGTVPPNGTPGLLTTRLGLSVVLRNTPFGNVTCTLPSLDLRLTTQLVGDQIVAVDDAVDVGRITCIGSLEAFVAALLVNEQLGLPVRGAYLCLASDPGLCPDGIAPTPTTITPTTITPTTTPARPAAPTNPAANPGNRRVRLTWKPPPGAGRNGVAFAYEVQRSVPGGRWRPVGIVLRPTTTYVDTNLTNGTTYRYRIVTVSPSSKSQASRVVSATPRTVPTVPRAVRANAGPRKVTVAWRPPANNGGRAVTAYRVQRAAKGGKWTTVATTRPSARSFTVRVPRQGTAVRMRVVAVNGAGPSVPSKAVSARSR